MMNFGSYGSGFDCSLAPLVHRALGGYEYALCEAQEGGVARFLAETELDGLNVPDAWQETAAACCASLSDTAARIGCADTLLRRDGGWYGDNTGAFGFRYTLERSGISPAGQKAVVLGSGGAAKTAQAVLSELGAAEVTLVPVDDIKNYVNKGTPVDADLLVNATTVGMYPNNGAAPVDLDDFPVCRAVIDLICSPLRTALLQQAETREIPAVNGLISLAAQAGRSASLFTGKEISAIRIEEVYGQLCKAASGIVLIGMPGCGKTMVGRMLAEAVGREFIDLDEEIERRTGRAPGELLTAEGEDAFRALETEVLADVSRYGGVVLATGSGTVVRPENYALLHQNGLIIWLVRKLCYLDISVHPLPAPVSLPELYSARAPLYEQWSDGAVDNNGTPQSAVAMIMRGIG